jgi:hypothetical protein
MGEILRDENTGHRVSDPIVVDSNQNVQEFLVTRAGIYPTYNGQVQLTTGIIKEIVSRFDSVEEANVPVIFEPTFPGNVRGAAGWVDALAYVDNSDVGGGELRATVVWCSDFLIRIKGRESFWVTPRIEIGETYRCLEIVLLNFLDEVSQR